VGQRDALAADGVTRRRAQIAVRFDASELGALDQAVEQSGDFGVALG
jgi:hypothetical protein